MAARWYRKPPLGATLRAGHPLTRGMVFCALLNEGGGINPSDIAGGQKLQPFPSSTYYPTWATEETGSPALQFVKSPGHITYAAQTPALSFGANPFSVSIWIKPTANDFSGGPMYIANRSTPPFWALYINGTAPLFWVNGSGDQRAQGGTLTAGQWAHIVGIRTGATTSELWLNGVKVSSGNGVDGGNVTSSSDKVSLGCAPEWGNYCDGQIRQAQLWNRALGAAEVQALYSDPYGFITPPPTIRKYFIPSAGGSIFNDSIALGAGAHIGDSVAATIAASLALGASGGTSDGAAASFATTGTLGVQAGTSGSVQAVIAAALTAGIAQAFAATNGSLYASSIGLGTAAATSAGATLGLSLSAALAAQYGVSATPQATARATTALGAALATNPQAVLTVLSQMGAGVGVGVIANGGLVFADHIALGAFARAVAQQLAGVVAVVGRAMLTDSPAFLATVSDGLAGHATVTDSPAGGATIDEL